MASPPYAILCWKLKRESNHSITSEAFHFASYAQTSRDHIGKQRDRPLDLQQRMQLSSQASRMGLLHRTASMSEQHWRSFRIFTNHQRHLIRAIEPTGIELIFWTPAWNAYGGYRDGCMISQWLLCWRGIRPREDETAGGGDCNLTIQSNRFCIFTKLQALNRKQLKIFVTLDFSALTKHTRR